MKTCTLLLTAGITILAASQSWGQDVEIIASSVVSSEIGDPPGFTVSNTDLLQTAFGSVSGSDLVEVGGTSVTGETALRDGIWNNNGQSRADAGVSNDEDQTYLLDLAASPSGYTISGIDLFSNWGPGGGRDEIRVNISFSLVATPDAFDQILVVEAANPLFLYNPPNETQGKLSLSGFRLDGVAGIRFFWPSPQENAAVGYAEIDIFGTSTGNDTDAPTLSSTVPATGAIDVATVSNLVLTFNEEVRAGSGNIELRTTDTNTLVESFDAASSPRLSFLGRELSVDPTDDLLIGTEYYLAIPSGAIEDLSANPFAGIAASPDADAYRFTSDATEPMLIAGEPLINGLPAADLTIRFDEPILAGTGQITIHLASNDSVVETITVPGAAISIADNVATVDIADLQAGVAYYVNFSEGTFTDLSGNAAAGVTETDTIAFTTVSTSLIHHWEFEDDEFNTIAADSIGSHQGTLRGSTAFAEGVIGQAVNLTVGGNAVIVEQPSLPATNFTVACWINPTEISGNRTIAGTRKADLQGAFIRLQDGGLPSVHLISSEETRVVTAGEPVLAGEWTHLAYTVDETNGLILYVNGQPVASDPEATTHSIADNFNIGVRPEVLVDYFIGLIDEVQIHAAVLSQSQITDLVGGGTGVPEVPLEITEINLTSDNMLTLTWNSNENDVYTIRFSPDMIDWAADLDDEISADPGQSTTRTFDITGIKQLNGERLFFRIER